MLVTFGVEALCTATLVGLFGSACILPPEGLELSERVNALPEFEPETLVPREARFEVPYDCSSFRVSARVRDKNDAELLFRVVANADLPEQRFIVEGTITEPELGRYRDAQARVVLSADFPQLVAAADPRNPPFEKQVGILSLFVTDAQEWLVPNDEVETAEGGLGDIVNPASDGFEPYGVVENRWTVVILTEGGMTPGECF